MGQGKAKYHDFVMRTFLSKYYFSQHVFYIVRIKKKLHKSNLHKLTYLTLEILFLYTNSAFKKSVLFVDNNSIE